MTNIREFRTNDNDVELWISLNIILNNLFILLLVNMWNAHAFISTIFSVFDDEVRCFFATLKLEVLRDLEGCSEKDNNSKAIS